MRRRAFTLFRDGCVTLDIAASSTLIWRIPHQIPSTEELDIELSLKLFAIALSDVQAGLQEARILTERGGGGIDYAAVTACAPSSGLKF